MLVLYNLNYSVSVIGLSILPDYDKQKRPNGLVLIWLGWRVKSAVVALCKAGSRMTNVTD